MARTCIGAALCSRVQATSEALQVLEDRIPHAGKVFEAGGVGEPAHGDLLDHLGEEVQALGLQSYYLHDVGRGGVIVSGWAWLERLGRNGVSANRRIKARLIMVTPSTGDRERRASPQGQSPPLTVSPKNVTVSDSAAAAQARRQWPRY